MPNGTLRRGYGISRQMRGQSGLAPELIHSQRFLGIGRFHRQNDDARLRLEWPSTSQMSAPLNVRLRRLVHGVPNSLVPLRTVE